MKPYDKTAVNRLIKRLEGWPGTDPAQTRALLAELRRAAVNPNADNRYLWLLGDYLPDSDGWPFQAATLTATLYAFHAQKFPDSKAAGGHKIPSFKDEDEPETTDELNPNKRPYRRRSFGESVRRLRMQLNNNENAQKSLDKRFVALLETGAEDLEIPLRGFIQRIATAKNNIPVSYLRLLEDLLRWEGEAGDTVRRRWARDYWQPDLTAYADFGPNDSEPVKQTN